MQTIERKLGDFDKMQFTVHLDKYGKTSADVADIFFSVKENLTDADTAIHFKSYLTSGISFTGTKVLTVLVDWAETEYNNVSAGKEYQAGLFIKFTGDPTADEHVKETFLLKIVQDFLQQN